MNTYSFNPECFLENILRKRGLFEGQVQICVKYFKLNKEKYKHPCRDGWFIPFAEIADDCIFHLDSNKGV